MLTAFFLHGNCYSGRIICESETNGGFSFVDVLDEVSSFAGVICHFASRALARMTSTFYVVEREQLLV